jgi:hypothetical protein
MHKAALDGKLDYIPGCVWEHAFQPMQVHACVHGDKNVSGVWCVQVRLSGEYVKPHEVHFKLHPAEIPVKNKVIPIH